MQQLQGALEAAEKGDVLFLRMERRALARRKMQPSLGALAPGLPFVGRNRHRLQKNVQPCRKCSEGFLHRLFLCRSS
jgi:hypothetical protein